MDRKQWGCHHVSTDEWELGCDMIDTTETDGPEMQPRQSVFLECLHENCHWILRDREILEYLGRLRVLACLMPSPNDT